MVCILFWRCYIAVESFEATRHGEDETGEDCKHRCSANFTHGRPGSGSYFPQIICCCMNIICKIHPWKQFRLWLPFMQTNPTRLGNSISIN